MEQELIDCIETIAKWITNEGYWTILHECTIVEYSDGEYYLERLQ